MSRHEFAALCFEKEQSHPSVSNVKSAGGEHTLKQRDVMHGRHQKALRCILGFLLAKIAEM